MKRVSNSSVHGTELRDRKLFIAMITAVVTELQCNHRQDTHTMGPRQEHRHSVSGQVLVRAA